MRWRKCAAVFLGKINQDILNLRREKIAPNLFENYKQLIVKTDDHPKLLFGDDLSNTIKGLTKTNKAGQSLNQRYQPTPKREKFNKTGEPFLYKGRGCQQRGRRRQNVQPYPPYQQKQSKYRFSKNTVVLNQVSELLHEVKFLNKKSKAGVC